MGSERAQRLKMVELFWLGVAQKVEKFYQPRTIYLMIKLETLKSSVDFQKAKKGLFYRSKSFLLQAFEDKACNRLRVGYTVSKQNGNAVVRNRIKRRLRIIARNIIGKSGNKNWNYVIIGKKNSLVEDFAKLEIELNVALKYIHAKN